MKNLVGKSVWLTLTLASSALAGLTSGTVTLDGKVIQYQAYSGTSAASYQQFLQGANLVNFESVPGVTAEAVNSYNSATTTAANLIDPKTAINGAYFSAGGQTPGNPANGGNPAGLVDVSALNGAHSGKNVLGPTAQGDPTEPLDFNNGFISVNFQLNQPISRFGWWTNPNGGKVAFPPHMNTFDSSDNMVDLSAGLTFDSAVINEVELFQGGPMTVDDFTFARDKTLPFGSSVTSTVPEPASWTLSILGIGIGLLSLFWVRRTPRNRPAAS
jgi:hypothetical protein